MKLYYIIQIFFPIIFKVLLVRLRSWFPGDHLDSNLGSFADSWAVVVMNKLLNLTRNNYKKIYDDEI